MTLQSDDTAVGWLGIAVSDSKPEICFELFLQPPSVRGGERVRRRRRTGAGDATDLAGTSRGSCWIGFGDTADFIWAALRASGGLNEMNDEGEVAVAVSDIENIDNVAFGGLVFLGVLVTEEREPDDMAGGGFGDEVGLAAGERGKDAGRYEDLAPVLGRVDGRGLGLLGGCGGLRCRSSRLGLL